MIYEKTWQELLKLYRAQEHAPLFFRDMAAMRAPRPRIDVQRRIQAINKVNRLSLPLSVGVAFYKRIAELGLGIDELANLRGKRNPGIVWTEETMRCFEVGRRVLELAKGAEIEEALKVGDRYPFLLESGQSVMLSKSDLVRLKSKLKEWM